MESVVPFRRQQRRTAGAARGGLRGKPGCTGGRCWGCWSRRQGSGSKKQGIQVSEHPFWWGRGLQGGRPTADSPAQASPDTQLCSRPAGQSLSTGRSEGPSRVRAEWSGGRRASASGGLCVCALPTPDSTGSGTCQRPEARVESPGMRRGMEPGPGPASSCPDAFHPRARRAQNHSDWSRQAGVLTEELKRSLLCPHAHPSSSPPSSSAPGVLPGTVWLELGTYVHSAHRPPCASAVPVHTRQPSHVALGPHMSAPTSPAWTTLLPWACCQHHGLHTPLS